MKYYIIAGLLLTLGACSNEAAIPRHKGGLSSAVEISNARVRPPLPGQKIAAGYFTLTSAKGDRLLSVTSPASPRVELHNHINDAGVLRMRRIDGGVVIPVGGQIEFKPGHFHVMLFDAMITEQSEDVALTFDFEHADDVTIIADIMTSQSHGSGQTSGEDDKKTYGSGH